jgi:hypothetical protein
MVLSKLRMRLVLAMLTIGTAVVAYCLVGVVETFELKDDRPATSQVARA